MRKTTILFLFLVVFFQFNLKNTFANSDSTEVNTNPYNVNYFVEIPLSVAGLVGIKYGNHYVSMRMPKHPENIPFLKPSDIWFFDRGATKQDPSQIDKNRHYSDIVSKGALWAPIIMLLDPKVREIWSDFAVLHFETQVVNGIAYLAGTIPVRRLRPTLYNPGVSDELKYGEYNTNSFFSGHTSVVASSTFFMVKVYYDLHPEAKNKMLFYGLATIPPAVGGYFRYKAGKHFPTDILMGIAVGGLTGILVPEFHKKDRKLKVYPVALNGGGGIYVRLDLN